MSIFLSRRAGYSALPVAALVNERFGTPISTRADLAAINGSSGIFYLANDIDLAGADWVPVSFSGMLDMSGFTISNMTVTPTSSGGGHAGLFSNAGHSIICRGRILNSTVSNGSAANYAGMLAGLFDDALAYDMIFQGCTVYTAGDRAGSVVGLARRGAFRRILDLDTIRSGGTTRTGSIVAVVVTNPNETRSTSNNFYNSASGWPAVYGTAKTTAQLKAATTYPVTDFNPNVYNIVDGFYPTFKTLAYSTISSRAELEAVFTVAGTNRGLYRLVNNIDLAGAEFLSAVSFAGILDGDGYRITNLTRDTVAAHGGLIHVITDFGVVENLSLHGTMGAVSSSDASYKGLLTGDSYGAIIVNSKVSGLIYGLDRKGGFSGFCRGGIFHKCLSACNVGNSGTRVGAAMGFEWDEGGQIGAPWGVYNVNAINYSGNNIALYTAPTAPDPSRAWTDPTATTAANYTGIWWSPDLWSLVDGALPEFNPR